MSLINEPINECLVCRCPLYHIEHQKAYNWKAIQFASERLKQHLNLIKLAEKQCADAFDYYATIDLKKKEIRLLQVEIRLAQIEEQKQAQIKKKIQQEQALQKEKEAQEAIIKARLFEAKKIKSMREPILVI